MKYLQIYKLQILIIRSYRGRPCQRLTFTFSRVNPPFQHASKTHVFIYIVTSFHLHSDRMRMFKYKHQLYSKSATPTGPMSYALTRPTIQWTVKYICSFVSEFWWFLKCEENFPPPHRLLHGVHAGYQWEGQRLGHCHQLRVSSAGTRGTLCSTLTQVIYH